MKFRPNTERDSTGDWIYRTLETGKAVEVRISYWKGSSFGQKRGIQIMVNTVDIGPVYPGAHFQSCTYDLLAGLNMHVLTLARKSDKATNHAAEWFSNHLDAITRTWETEGKVSTKQLLTGLVSDFNDINHPAQVQTAATVQGVQVHGI